jgi:hypothetical protein
MVVLLALASCARDEGPPAAAGTGAESVSPRPRPELVEALREDLETPRHASDGGGRAWLDLEASTPPPIRAGETARLEVVYEAGPLGVDEDGVVFLQSSPFWGWSPPQDLDEDLPGYTVATSEAGGLYLETETFADGLLAIHIRGRRLESGERLRIAYGAGPLGTRVDRYAESGSRVWIAVDGDGDGVRSLVPDPPEIDIEAGEPVGLIATLPSIAHPGDTVRLTLALVDGVGNAGAPVAATLRLTSSPEGLELPSEVRFEPADAGASSLDVVAPESGIFEVVVESDAGLGGRSNPLFVTAKLPRLLWADLHGHSKLSDGTQTPEGYFRDARDVAGLDVVALTDHDHWGMQPLALHPERWAWIREATARFHQPGRFVTVLGYEWTNWMQGHRHVLYFGDEGEILDSLDPAYDHPSELWAALRGRPALTFAHHSAGEPVPTNWEVPPDPELEPVTEIVSVHGSSEAMDSPGLLRGPVPGNTVRDALDRGYVLGFIGSGDSHDGHPGLAGLASPSAGLAALLTDDLSREGVREALRARRVYATNGPRILLHVTLDGLPMGSLVEPGAATDPPGPDEHRLIVLALGPRPIVAADLVRSGEIVESIEIAGVERLFRVETTLPRLAPGEYFYVRVFQDDGGAAWSSPFFAGRR